MGAGAYGTDLMSDAILILALLLAGVVFWRLHQARIAPATATPADSPGAPAGAGTLALGQYAVAADRQWLLIQPGT